MNTAAPARRRRVLLSTALAIGVALSSPALLSNTAVAKAGHDPAGAVTSVGRATDLGLLYIGAHPDDEAFFLSTLGEWKQRYGLKAGVVTITRGEGGGNAAGPEEGPALGLLREGEERRAVASAGVTDIFYLDKVDFYYTVSDQLTADTWGHDDTLARVVRVIRQTRPEVIATMNPAPSPGNHGNHQQAARLAVEAYQAAGDPTRFPEQITREGLRPFSPDRIFTAGLTGTSSVGPNCPVSAKPADATQNVFGVWSGTTSPDGRTWAAVERSSQRLYVSQGWAGFPDVPTDPNLIGCDFLTQLDSRVPFPEPGTPGAAAVDGALAGALTHQDGTLPLGTGLSVSASPTAVLPGGSVTATLTISAPQGQILRHVALQPVLPAGWTASAVPTIDKVLPGRTVTAQFTVTAAASAATSVRARIGVRVSSAQGTGYTDRSVQVVPLVSAQQQWLPQVAKYETWTRTVDVPQLSGRVFPVLTMGSGTTTGIPVVVTNNSTTTQSGTVTIAPPAGFTAATATLPYGPLAPQATAALTFTVTNTNTALQTGAPGGDYAYTLTATTTGNPGVTSQALELVPVTTVPHAPAAPVVDGVLSPGEYTGAALDISRRWEGSNCANAADCSGLSYVTWSNDTLYVGTQVTDDIMGTALATSDCKRHWRTDSLEINIDPRGTSENTSTTFKAAVLPFTQEGPPCALRDADNHQGTAAETAPGMTWASAKTATGWIIEVAIPMSLLPSAVDPGHMGLNILYYDSDTQDKTGQTRLGWSVWGGVQGDPYRWGLATLDGYVPPAGRPTTPSDPIMPLSFLSSLDSPQSIAQSVVDKVGLAGLPVLPMAEGGRVVSATLGTGAVDARLVAGAAGEANVFVVDANGTIGSRTVSVARAGTSSVHVPLTAAPSGTVTVLVAWSGADVTMGTLSSRVTAR